MRKIILNDVAQEFLKEYYKEQQKYVCSFSQGDLGSIFLNWVNQCINSNKLTQIYPLTFKNKKEKGIRIYCGRKMILKIFFEPDTNDIESFRNIKNFSVLSNIYEITNINSLVDYINNYCDNVITEREKRAKKILNMVEEYGLNIHQAYDIYYVIKSIPKEIDEILVGHQK